MKKLLLSLLLLLPSGGFSQDLASGLVACYAFTGNADDGSGNGNHGTVNGAVLTFDRFGNGNSAYAFDGADDYIGINPDLLKNNNYTYAFWAKAASSPTVGASYFIFSVGGPGGDQSVGLNNVYSGPNSGWTGGGYNQGGSNQFVAAGSLPAIGVWYHLAVTRDGNGTRFYVNGTLVGTVPNKNGTAFYGSTYTRANVGGRSTLTQFFHGAVDDLRLYNRALSAEEVQALYQAPNVQALTLRSDYLGPCAGTRVTYSVLPAAPGARYQWFVNGVKQGEPTASGTFTYPSPPGTTTYQATVSVEVFSGAACATQRLESTLSFTPPAPILADLTASTLVPCAGSPVTFMVSPGIVGARYQWRINGVMQSSEAPVIVHTFPPTSARYEALIQVDITPPDIPCAGTTSRELRLTLYPALTVACPSPDFAIAGDSIRYEAPVTGGQPPYRYFWVIGNDTLPGTDRAAVTYAFPEPGRYAVSLLVIDSRACRVSCELEQTVIPPLFFPNVFTPDGDGKNETFTVAYAGDDFEMAVYNRWGKRVAVTHDGVGGWDGQNAPGGVYFYEIRIGRRQYKGWVSLLR